MAPAGHPTKIRSNLWIQEVDIQEEVGRHWKHVHGYVASLLNISGLNEILAQELAIFPGMEEVSSLMYINQYMREDAFDVILLDCAPTAESCASSAFRERCSGTWTRFSAIRFSTWNGAWPR